MNERLEVKRDGEKIYDIVFSRSLDGFIDEFKKLGYGGRRVCIVTDSSVGPLHGDALMELLKPVCSKVCVFVFQAGEENKTLDTVRKLYELLIGHRFDRKDCLIALGGGVTGDLTGFAAATYLRGIGFIQMPTSLLAIADSSIGGKTGVDFDAYKNMVGAFWMPRLVYVNLSCLKTLPEKQFYNGMAEIIKAGLIRNLDFYVFLLENMGEILTGEEAAVARMLQKSCEIKRAVVEEDPTEQGIRALLNFGHTIGHSIEKLSGFSLLHGECVALGMVCAAYLSWKRGYLTKEEYLEIRDVLVAFRLPVTVDGLDAQVILDMTKTDKKMDGGTIRFILLKAVGEAFIDTTVTDEELLDAIRATVLGEGAGEKDAQNNDVVRLSDILSACDDFGASEESHEKE